VSDARRWLKPAAAGVIAITFVRVVLLAVNGTDLFVDEAQYWLWSQEMALGYYSKPPLIGWVIGLFTVFSDATFWVRLPAPLFHGATAMILGAIADRLFGARAAVVTALAYVTLPMLKGPLISLALVKAVESLRSFDLIFVMTGGGPGTATETLDLYAYQMGINMGGRISYASAMSILLLIVTTVAFTIIWKAGKKWAS